MEISIKEEPEENHSEFISIKQEPEEDYDLELPMQFVTTELRDDESSPESGNLRPFQCDQCQGSYRDKRSLKKHKHSVHEPFKFKCCNCPMLFRFHYRMRSHAKIVHGLSLKTPKTEPKIKPVKEFPCKLCEKVFNLNTGLNRHMRTVHVPDEGKYKCEICQKGFKTQYHVDMHRRKVHGEKEKLCENLKFFKTIKIIFSREEISM